MESTNQVPVAIAAEHYVNGYKRGQQSERDRILRLIYTEWETTENIAKKNGTDSTKAHNAVIEKLNLIYEMAK